MYHTNEDINNNKLEAKNRVYGYYMYYLCKFYKTKSILNNKFIKKVK